MMQLPLLYERKYICNATLQLIDDNNYGIKGCYTSFVTHTYLHALKIPLIRHMRCCPVIHVFQKPILYSMHIGP